MTGAPLLVIDDIEVVYQQAILALRGLSLHVGAGQAVTLLGANGAGKSTALKAVSNLLRAERGRVTRGRILFEGQDIGRLDTADLVEAGVIQVLEGRRCFPQLTVEENLISGAVSRRLRGRALRAALDRVYDLFPRLVPKRALNAGYTSGGEQQMVAIGRALMARPRLIALDEPSMGLAPLVVEEIFAILHRLRDEEGISLLIAEQNAAVALAHADHAYIIENGRAVIDGPAAEIAARTDVRDLYFGLKTTAERTIHG